MPRHFLVFLLVLALLTGCSRSPAGPATEEPAGGWVELDDDFVLDESSFAKVTPAPVEPVTMPLAEAQARLPFEFALPAWAPDGFVLQDEVEVLQPASGLGYTSVSLTWLNGEATALYLQVAQADDEQPALGAVGSTEAVTVNGQPATLRHTSRLGAESLALTWPRGDLTYTLTTEAGAATPEALQRMAESVG